MKYEVKENGSSIWISHNILKKRTD